MLVVLGVVLLILKLAGVIGWAWWIILIPFYPALALLLFAGFCFVMAGAMQLLAAIFGRKRRFRY